MWSNIPIVVNVLFKEVLAMARVRHTVNNNNNNNADLI